MKRNFIILYFLGNNFTLLQYKFVQKKLSTSAHSKFATEPSLLMKNKPAVSVITNLSEQSINNVSSYLRKDQENFFPYIASFSLSSYDLMFISLGEENVQASYYLSKGIKILEQQKKKIKLLIKMHEHEITNCMNQITQIQFNSINDEILDPKKQESVQILEEQIEQAQKKALMCKKLQDLPKDIEDCLNKYISYRFQPSRDD